MESSGEKIPGLSVKPPFRFLNFLAVAAGVLWVPLIVASYAIDQVQSVDDVVPELVRLVSILLVCFAAIFIASKAQGIRLVKGFVFTGAALLVAGSLLNIAKEISALDSAPLIGEGEFFRPSWTRDSVSYAGAGILLSSCIFAILDAVRTRHALLADVAIRRRAEEEAHRHREYFETTLTSIGDGVIATDREGRVTFMNPVAEQVTGWTLADAKGRDSREIFNIVNEDTRQTVESPVTKVLAEGVVAALANHTVLIARDGTERPIDDSGAPIRDSQGKLVGAVLVFRDITERRRAEEAKAKLAAIVEHSNDAVVSEDLDGTIRHWNKAAERTFGYTSDEVVGKPVSILFAPGRAEDLQKIVDVVRRGDIVNAYETQRRCKDGTIIDVMLTVSPIKDRYGRIVGMSKISRDITEKKKAEQELREQREWFETTLASIGDAVIATDHEGRITFMNPVAEQLTGWLLEDAEGRDSREIFNIVNEDTRNLVESPVQRVLREGKIVGLANHTVLIARDGAEHPIDDSGAPIRDANGNVIGVVLVFRDISERKRAVNALRKSEGLLRAVVDTAVDGIITIDEKGMIQTVNPAVARIFGYSPEELIGRNVRILMPEPYQAEHDGYLSAYIKTGIKKIIGMGREVRGKRKNGSVFPLDLAVSETKLADRRIFTGILRDVTQRVEAEEELARRARQQAAVAVLGQHALLRNDLQEIFDEAVQLTASTLNVEFCKVVELIPGEDHMLLRAGVGWKEGLVGAATLDTGKNSQAGYTLEAKEPVLVEDLRTESRFSGPTLLTDHGVVSGMSCIIWQGDRAYGVLGTHSKALRKFTPDDVSFLRSIANVLGSAIQRAQAEEALRESEGRFRFMADAAPVLIWMAGRDKLCTYFNRQWLEYTGRTMEQELGNGWTESVHPEDLQRVWQTYSSASDRQEEFRLEYRLRRADGQYRWIFDHGVPYGGPEESFLGYIGGCIDITDRMEAEQRMASLNETLEERVVERTAIAEQRSRQLRALAAELTQAEQKERRRLAQLLHDHLQQILVAAKFKVSMFQNEMADSNGHPQLQEIDDLLHQAIEASRSLTVELSPPILYDGGLAPALPWLARWMNEKHGFKVLIEADPEAEPKGEEVRVLLFQAVRELLFNAVKHSKVKEANVTMKRLDPEHLQVVVEDKGSGFDPTNLDRRESLNQGFGLFSIRERLGHLGGRLDIESSLGKGTRLTLVAPIRPTSAKLTAEKAMAVSGSKTTPTREDRQVSQDARAERTTGNVRVLLVDDHEIVREGLAGLLAGEKGIEVIGQAADGETAVELATKLVPDVVVMDISLPGISGIEATRRITSQLPEVKVIGLSMHVHEDMAASMRQAGAADYFPKDGPSDALVAAIREH